MKSAAWDGDWPVSQEFGENAAAYARFNLAGHNGLDLAMASGTPLFAPEPGVVTEVGSDPPGYGYYVKLEPVQGGNWIFAHLMPQGRIQQGALVDRGTFLGYSDNSGNSTGPHLHLGRRPPGADRLNGYGGYENPRPYLESLSEAPQETDDMPNEERQQLLARIAELEADQARTNSIKAQMETYLRDGAFKKQIDREARRRRPPIAPVDVLIEKGVTA